MIAVPVRGNNFRGIFEYHEKKIKEGVAREIGRTDGLSGMEKHHLICDFNRRIEDYKEEQTKGRKLERFTFHPHLDFAKEDLPKLTDELLLEIGDKYMKAMGYGECEYVVYRHLDREHPHIHIASSVIDINYKRVDKSLEKRRSYDVCRALELEYGLTIATERNRNIEKELERHGPEIDKVKNHQTEDLNIKYGYGCEMLINIALDNVLSSPDVTGFEQFSAALEKEGVKPIKIEKKGKVVGLKYAIQDELDPSKTAFSINASKTKKRVTLKYLENAFARNLGDSKEVIRKVIDQTLSRGVNTLDSFEKQLAKEGITLLKAENSGGVYGLSFKIGEKTFKGSELGKEYSLKGILSKFGSSQDIVSAIRKAAEGISADTNLEGFFTQLRCRGVRLVKGPDGLELRMPGSEKGAKISKAFKNEFESIRQHYSKVNTAVLNKINRETYSKEEAQLVDLIFKYNDRNTSALQKLKLESSIVSNMVKEIELKLTPEVIESLQQDAQELIQNYYSYNSFIKAKAQIKEAIDNALKESTYTLGQLEEKLKHRDITLVRSENSGGVYGISFKAGRFLFKGSELGKRYSFVSISKQLKSKSPEKDVKRVFNQISKETNAAGVLTQLYLKGIKKRILFDTFEHVNSNKSFLDYKVLGKGWDKFVEQDIKVKEQASTDFLDRLYQNNFTAEEAKLINAVFALNDPATNSKSKASALNTVFALHKKGVALKLEPEVLDSFNKDIKVILDDRQQASLPGNENVSSGSSVTIGIFNLIQSLFFMFDSGPGVNKKKKKGEDEDDENKRKYYPSL